MGKKDKQVIAIMYDFDKTLCTKNMQEYSFIPNVGLKPSDFWEMSEKLSKKEKMDGVLAYMRLMITEAMKHDISIHREDFVKLGSSLKFYNGVTEWFDRINKYGQEKGVIVEHYIISSGLYEIIEGSSIFSEFKDVFACEFLYDVNGVACWPKNVVNYTTKTQFLFRINKGVTDLSDDKTLNEYTPENNRRVPFRNMIYIADGLTDVPCMRLVKSNGGFSIAVYQSNKNSKEISKKLMVDDRVNFAVPANYTEGEKLDVLIKDIIDQMVINEKLINLNEKQKSKL
ncbi:HAD family hydrolase [Eubacterium sp.]|uniref:HAD family hydrolase n=1 Tax=Eubacterium sp. TaxID=142586 RepID=UPI0025FABF2F|nr:HAD family hydrolase [Eubacterium sp.]MCR5629904.1 haloacid dehalogenase-like hydrolase [Eubacterium sp.]